MTKIKIDEVVLHTYYGQDRGPRVKAWTWEDGPEGVNYSMEGIHTMFPMFTSRENFVRMANGEPKIELTGQAFLDSLKRR